MENSNRSSTYHWKTLFREKYQKIALYTATMNQAIPSPDFLKTVQAYKCMHAATEDI